MVFSQNAERPGNDIGALTHRSGRVDKGGLVLWELSDGECPGSASARDTVARARCPSCARRHGGVVILGASGHNEPRALRVA